MSAFRTFIHVSCYLIKFHYETISIWLQKLYPGVMIHLSIFWVHGHGACITPSRLKHRDVKLQTFQKSINQSKTSHRYSNPCSKKDDSQNKVYCTTRFLIWSIARRTVKRIKLSTQQNKLVYRYMGYVNSCNVPCPKRPKKLGEKQINWSGRDKECFKKHFQYQSFLSILRVMHSSLS